MTLGPVDDRLFRYAEGDLSREEMAELELQMELDGALHERAHSVLALHQELKAAPPLLADVDISDSIGRWIDSRSENERPPRRRWSPRSWALSAVGVAVAVAAIALVLRFGNHRGSSGNGEYRAKSSAAATADSDRWAGVTAFRLDRLGQVAPLGSGMRKSDELMFTYTNLGPRPYSHLMIFALDARGGVHWFYPSGEAAERSSIAIRPGEANVELPFRISHPYPRGPLRIRALFSHEPYSVDQIEVVAGRYGDAADRLPLPETGQQVLETSVEELP